MKACLYWFLAVACLISGCGKSEETKQDAKETTPPPATSTTPTTPNYEGYGFPVAGNTAPSTSGQNQPSTGQTQPSTPVQLAPNQLDLTYISDNFTTAVVVHPARVLNSPLVKALVDAGAPIDQPMSEFTEESGIDPRNVAQVVVLLDQDTLEMAPMMMGVPGFGPPGFDEDFGPAGPATPEIERQPLERFEQIKPEDGAADNAAIFEDTRGLQPVSTQVGSATQPAFEAPAETFESGEFEPTGPPMPTIIVRFVNPIDRAEFFSHAPEPLPEAVIDGLQVTKFPGGVLHFPDDKTLIATSEKLLKQVVSAKNVDSHLTRHLKAMDASQDLIIVADLKAFKGPLTQASGLLMFSGIPPEFAGLASIPSQLDAVTLGLGLSSKNLLELNLVLDSPANAAKAGTELTKLLEQARPQYEQSKGMLSENLKLENQAAKDKLMALADGVVNGLSASAEGPSLKIVIPQLNDPAGLVQLLKPEIDKAKKIAENSIYVNNLKQIGIAFLNYHEVYEAFPGAGSDGTGRQKGLSWRVHLLPMLDEYELYNEFHLDEPWDSEHNKVLIEAMPEVFKTPGTTKEGTTSLHVFVGDQAFALDRGLRIAEIRDGTSMTLLVVQAGADKADIWTKPGGLKADAKNLRAELGTIDGTSFPALFGDGSVQQIKADVPELSLKALITKNGREVIDRASFSAR